MYPINFKTQFFQVILYIEDVDLNDPLINRVILFDVILYIEDVDLNGTGRKERKTNDVILYIEDVDLNTPNSLQIEVITASSSTLRMWI